MEAGLPFLVHLFEDGPDGGDAMGIMRPGLVDAADVRVLAVGDEAAELPLARLGPGLQTTARSRRRRQHRLGLLVGQRLGPARQGETLRRAGVHAREAVAGRLGRLQHRAARVPVPFQLPAGPAARSSERGSSGWKVPVASAAVLVADDGAASGGTAVCF